MDLIVCTEAQTLLLSDYWTVVEFWLGGISKASDSVCIDTKSST